jgi:hypothetical protein
MATYEHLLKSYDVRDALAAAELEQLAGSLGET